MLAQERLQTVAISKSGHKLIINVARRILRQLHAIPDCRSLRHTPVAGRASAPRLCPFSYLFQFDTEQCRLYSVESEVASEEAMVVFRRTSVHTESPGRRSQFLAVGG